MDIIQLHDRVKQLETRMRAKELYWVEAEAQIHWCGYKCRIALSYRAFEGDASTDERWRIYDGDDWDLVEKYLQEAEKWVSDIPSKDQLQHEAFMKQLGRVIDRGRDIGIDLDVLNPLVESMKALSENILEDKR